MLSFIAEYRRVADLICKELWPLPQLQTYCKVQDLHVDTWLTSRALQACSKQVIATIKATRKSRWKLHSTETTPPDCSVIEPCLDNRFFSLDSDSETSFDYLLNLGSLGNKLKLRFQLKSTKHNNKLKASGKLLNSIHVSNKSVTLVYLLPDVAPASGATVGADIGITALATCSNGATAPCHKHGWTYSKILSKLAREKKGSKNFKAMQSLRDNFIGWFINQLNFAGVATVKLENIHDMRRGRRTDRFRSHWNYPKIYRKLEQKCIELGVQVQYIDQAYTSQECSACGAVNRKSRHGADFCCVACGHATNADANAALNIERRPALQAWRGAYNPSCS